MFTGMFVQTRECKIFSCKKNPQNNKPNKTQTKTNKKPINDLHTS